MCAEEVAKAYKALYPEELLERYNAGERNFQGINLLRAELEHIVEPGSLHLWIDPMQPESEAYSPLWADFRNPVDRRFEWDFWGRFIPIEYDDLLPPRDLAGVNLSGVDLTGAYLYPVDLSNANLSGADLREAKLMDANLQGVDLSRADLRDSILESANLRAANLYMARLERATLASSDLREANLRRAKLRKAVLVATDLRGADLKKAHFDRTWLNEADLRNTSLQDVELRNVCVTGVAISASQQAEFLGALGIRCRK